MKNKFILLLMILFLTACQDVVDIDLNTANPQFVIEGVVTDQGGPYRISITKTVNFDDLSEYPAVSGAFVVISDGHVTDTLTEVAPGIYQTQALPQGQAGRSYQLTVQAEGRTFAATSTMPAAVPFDSLTLDRGTLPFGGGERILVVPNYNDPLGLGNNYRFVQWINGIRLSGIFVSDDRNSDGIRVTRPLFAPGGDDDQEIKIGDTVMVEMLSIDRDTYKYFYALDAGAGNGPNAGVPANPDNNFGGACLGYFSAQTVQRRSLIIE